MPPKRKKTQDVLPRKSSRERKAPLRLTTQAPPPRVSSKVVLNPSLELDVADILFTQTHVRASFNNGTPLIDTALAMNRGELHSTDFPKIGVSRHPENGKYYSRDNRRLVLFKALEIETVLCEEVKWFWDFDDKLNDPTLVRYPELETKTAPLQIRNDILGMEKHATKTKMAKKKKREKPETKAT